MKSFNTLKKLTLALLATAFLAGSVHSQQIPQVYDRTAKEDPVDLKRTGFDTFGRKWRPGMAPEPAPAATPAPAYTPAPAPVQTWGNLVDISKTAPGMVALGETYDTTLNVKANRDAADVEVHDVIPEGAELVSSDPKATVNGRNLSWKFNAMDAGQANQIKVRYKAVKQGTLRSCAKVHALPRVCTVVVVGQPQLNITKTGPATAIINEAVSYTVKVSNTGNMTAKNVVVTDTIPAGLTHSSGQKKLTWTVGDLAAKDSRTFPVILTAAKQGTHCNKAMASSSNAGKVEAEACTKVLVRGIDIVKSGPAKQFLGKTAKYDIKVSNTGETKLTGLTITDNAPANTVIVSAPGAQVVGNQATWTLGSLDAGKSKNYGITLKALQAGTWVNNVGVNSAEGLQDRASAKTLWLGFAAVLVEMVDNPDPLLIGGTTTYTLKVTNQGTAADQDIAVVVNFPEQITPISVGGQTAGTIAGKKVTFAPLATLPAKAVATWTIQAKAAKQGDGRVKAEIRTRLLKDNPVTEIEATQVY